MPWGGAFGTPGPDSGYAFRVLAGRPLPMVEGEHRADVEQALAALMVARASHFGRAPVAEDADAAELLLGYRTEGLPAPVAAALSQARRRWLPGLAHNKHGSRRLVAALDAGLLAEQPEAIRERLAGGEPVLG